MTPLQQAHTSILKKKIIPLPATDTQFEGYHLRRLKEGAAPLVQNWTGGRGSLRQMINGKQWTCRA
jgi:hypothetical protein